MSESVRLYIERLKDALFVETDEELAQELGYSKQAIANWRRRNKVPDKAVQTIIQRAGPSFALDEWHGMHAKEREETVLFACLVHVYKEFLEKYPDDLDAAHLVLLGRGIKDAKESILDRIRDARNQSADIEEIVQYVSEIVAQKQANMLATLMFDYHARRRLVEE